MFSILPAFVTFCAICRKVIFYEKFVRVYEKKCQCERHTDILKCYFMSELFRLCGIATSSTGICRLFSSSRGIIRWDGGCCGEPSCRDEAKHK